MPDPHFASSPLRDALVANLESAIAAASAASRKLRRGSASVPHDEGAPMRELAEIYDLKVVLLTNFRNKWFGDGSDHG